MNCCKEFVVWGVGIFILLPQVYAASKERVESMDFRPLASITLGLNSVNPGRAQSLSLTPPFEDYYSKSNHSRAAGEFGVGLGIEHSIDAMSSWQAHISYYINSNFSTEGHIWQFGQPLFDNFKYQYSILHQGVMLSGKYILNSATYPCFHPYISGEVGLALNKAHNYFAEPLFPELISSLPFRSNTKRAFSWGVGLGVYYDLTSRLRVGAGYQLADAGAVSLGHSPEAQTDQSLHFSHLYTNQFRLQMTIEI